MENLMTVVKDIVKLNDVEKLELRKVEDSKIEVWEDGKYVGKYLVNYNKQPKLTLWQKMVGAFKNRRA